MDMTAIVLVVAFFTLLLLNVPISFSIGIATLIAMLMNIDFTPAVTTIAQRMAGGLDSFALLAIPFFDDAEQVVGVIQVLNKRSNTEWSKLLWTLICFSYFCFFSIFGNL